MKFIKIARNGSGWGGIYHTYLCDFRENYIAVTSIPELSMSKSAKSYRLAYNVFLKYIADHLPNCSYGYSGVGVMDHQDDRIIRVDDSGKEELIYMTEGQVISPDDPELTKMLNLFIDILNCIDEGTYLLDRNNKLYAYNEDEPISKICWFSVKRAVLSWYCDSISYGSITNGPHCENCLLKGLSSCRFLDPSRSEDYIDKKTISTCYDKLMSYKVGE